MNYATHQHPPYRAEEVAKALIKIADGEYQKDPETGEDTSDLTPLKLQKLLYFAQAAHLALYKKPLFEEEIEAWKLGPVIPVVYKAYKSYHKEPLHYVDGDEITISEKELEFLKKIWKTFGKYSPTELVNMTHRHEPWANAFKTAQNSIITKESIQNYYKDAFVA